MFRKIVAVLVVVPLGIVLVAFAVANRHIVTVSLDPFNTAAPAASLTLPLFALVLVLLIAGVISGGVAAWLGQGKWRREARRLQREAAAMRAELDGLRRTAEPSIIPEAAAPPPRLRLKPPAA